MHVTTRLGTGVCFATSMSMCLQTGRRFGVQCVVEMLGMININEALFSFINKDRKKPHLVDFSFPFSIISNGKSAVQVDATTAQPTTKATLNNSDGNLGRTVSSAAILSLDNADVAFPSYQHSTCKSHLCNYNYWILKIKVNKNPKERRRTPSQVDGNVKSVSRSVRAVALEPSPNLDRLWSKACKS